VRARALLPCLAILLFLAVTGCGGGGDEPGSTAATTAAQTETRRADQGKRQEAEPAGAQEAKPPRTSPDSAQPNPPIASERTPGSKAVAPGVPTTKGADNSVQAFGAEGQEGEASQAASTLAAYLGARADKDWPAACEEASEELTEELAKMIEQAKAKPDAEKPKGCAETLEALFGKSPAATLEQAAQIEQVLSFRIREDGYAYLIYEAPQGAVRFIAMKDDNGTWKVNTLEPASFPETTMQGSAQ